MSRLALMSEEEGAELVEKFRELCRSLGGRLTEAGRRAWSCFLPRPRSLKLDVGAHGVTVTDEETKRSTSIPLTLGTMMVDVEAPSGGSIPLRKPKAGAREVWARASFEGEFSRIDLSPTGTSFYIYFRR